MKIGICCYPSYGGSGVVATELGIKLSELGHEIHFISYDKPFRLGEYHDNVYFHSIEVSSYPVFKHPPYIMNLANKLFEISEREKLDILHSHYAVPHSTAMYLAKQMSSRNIKTVTTLHGTDVTIMAEDPNLKEVTEFSINNCDAITSVSECLKSDAMEMLNLDLDIKMIHNFIDSDLYKRSNNKTKKCLKINDDEKVIIHTSNFRKVKRVEDVIKIFYNINKEINSRLIMVGDGPKQRDAYDLAKDLGIIDKVNFIGKQNTVISILSQGDLFLLPSEKESFGLAALEAMSCEVPVIATRVGGIPELVDHGKNGFLSEIGNVEEMADYAISLLEDEELMKEFRQNAREAAVKKFNTDKIVREYENLYKSLLDGSL